MKPCMLGLLAALALSMQASRAVSLPRQSIGEFLRDVYAAEAARIANSQRLGEAEILTLFTPQVVELWLAARAHPDPALREGPAPDAFFGWG